jgi:XTP/dITP diphosphohydrolase
MKMVLASKNQKKLRELQAILGELGMECMLEQEAGVDLEVEETGTTFEENAYLKAHAVMEATGLPAIADDSGLEVDALDGAPGVYSARYGGAACTSDADRNALLLRNLEQVPDNARTARFVSVITCCMPDGTVVSARGTCEGEILRAGRGSDGFGYDPLFYVPQEGKTFAELPAERKNAISHRGRALQAFVQKMKETEYVDK